MGALLIYLTAMDKISFRKDDVVKGANKYFRGRRWGVVWERDSRRRKIGV